MQRVGLSSATAKTLAHRVFRLIQIATERRYAVSDSVPSLPHGRQVDFRRMVLYLLAIRVLQVIGQAYFYRFFLTPDETPYQSVDLC